MNLVVYQVCPKCSGEGSHDRGEETLIDPCATCNGTGKIETQLFIDISQIMDELEKIKVKIK